jgi:predicted NBD/HSP70 family sugar kinase
MDMAAPRNTSSFKSTQGSDILRLIRTGEARSRADIARQTGLSPSTASARVEALIGQGYIHETGTGESLGGRKPRRLEMRADAGVVGCADLGTHHGSLGLVDLAGALVAERHLAMDIADGPDAVLAWVLEQLTEMVAAAGFPPSALRGISIGVPGPVDSRSQLVVSPSRMPGWNGVDVRAILGRLAPLPVLVGNDANLMALGEYVSGRAGAENQVFVKVGSGIGCGVIATGELYVGSHGAAGDISHVPVPDAPPVPCSCGRTGCLDALASGAALVQRMRDEGTEVADIEAVIGLASDAHPLATRLAREAGAMTGGVLATIVNFFNPDRLVLGGNLSQSDVFVAAVRATIYAQCLPMATEKLEIVVSSAGTSGGLLGAGTIMLDHLFSEELVPLS